MRTFAAASHRDKGFTTVELLAVMLCIAILLLLAAPSFLGKRDRAYNSVAQQTLAVGGKHMATEFVDNGQRAFPTSANLVSKLNGSEPQYDFHDYGEGMYPSTGPTDISVSVDETDIATMCVKSRTRRFYCHRQKGTGPLMGVTDTVQRSSGYTEPDARCALATTSTLPALCSSGIPGVGVPLGSEVDNEDLLYASLESGNYEVYRIAPDGTNKRNLTNSSSIDYYASWSQDHRRIVFSSNRSGNYDLWVANADDSNPVNVTNTPSVTENTTAEFSPNGQKIAYGVAGSGATAGVWIRDANGTNPVRVRATGGNPSWSADGTRLAFTDGGDIWTIRADGTGAVNLTPGTASSDGGAEWTPDGARIVFNSTRTGTVDIYSMRANGTDLRRLTTNSRTDTRAQVSRDGSKIFYDSQPGPGNIELYIMNIDGTNPHLVSTPSSPKQVNDW